MIDLKTNYMGLELKNPVIVGANDLITEPESLKKIEKLGAGAVVFKSLFEEQFQLENLEYYEQKREYEERHAEMITLYPESSKEPQSPVEHLAKLKKAKESVSIPLIASLNAVNEDSWVQFATEIEKTGVDGLELNLYTIPEKSGDKFYDTEKSQIRILEKVKSAVKIPVAVKLSPYYSNPLKFISELEHAGASAFVLFNRLFQPDIDIEAEKLRFPYNLSYPGDNRLPLRFAGLLYGNTKSSVCTSSGIFTGNDVIKMLLAGADCVQVVSTLYQNRLEVLGSILEEIETWMKKKGYKSVNSFRGKLSGKNSENRLPYHRAQYIDFKLSTSAILNKYKTIR